MKIIELTNVELELILLIRDHPGSEVPVVELLRLFPQIPDQHGSETT